MQLLCRILIAVTAAALAQSAAAAGRLAVDQVPGNVRGAVSRAYPDAQPISWDVDERGLFVADFERDGLAVMVKLTPTGKIVRSRTEMHAEKLPDTVREGVMRVKPHATILGGSRLMCEGHIVWDVCVKLGPGAHCNLRLTNEGVLLQ